MQDLIYTFSVNPLNSFIKKIILILQIINITKFLFFFYSFKLFE